MHCADDLRFGVRDVDGAEGDGYAGVLRAEGGWMCVRVVVDIWNIKLG